MKALSLLAARSALVLKEVTIDENGPLYVRIVGRKPGLIAWILNMLQIDTTTIFEVYWNRILFEEGSLFGRLKQNIPMKKVCNLGTGYTKPFHWFLLSILFTIGGIYSLFAARDSDFSALAFLPFLIALVFLFCYIFGKTMILYVFPSSGIGASVLFKRSLIEGVKITEEDAERVTNIITYLIDASNAK